MFLEISWNSQENTCTRDFFYSKRDSGTGVFLKFTKFIRTPFFTEHLRWLLLWCSESKKKWTVRCCWCVLREFGSSFAWKGANYGTMDSRCSVNKELPHSAPLLRKNTLAQVLPCQFFKILQNTYITEHLCTTAFGWFSMKI